MVGPGPHLIGERIKPTPPPATEGMSLTASAIVGLIVTSIVCAVAFSGGLPSASTDIAFHYSLSDVLSRYGGRYAPALEMYMDTYPALAHWMAAIVARVTGSVMQAILSVGAMAVGATYFVILYILARTSMIAAGLFVCACAAALSLKIDYGVLLGFELVTNYFFGQIVALAFCWISLLLLAPVLERGPAVHVTFLTAVLVFVVTAGHLVPGLELAGAIGVLMLYRTLRSRRWVEFAGFCAVVGGMLLIHPSVRIMLTVSANDGTIALPNLVLAATPVVAIIDILLACVILRTGYARGSGRIGGSEIIAAAAMSTAGLCLLQAIALRVGYGSEYAVGKYAHGVYTLAMVQAAMLVGSVFRAGPASARVASAFAAAGAVLIVAFILPRPVVSTAAFDQLARYARHSAALLGQDAAKETIVLTRSLHPAASFMVTAVDIGNKRATGDYTLLAGHMPDPSTFRYAVVDAGDPLFPRTCDVDLPASSYRVVRVQCALSSISRLPAGQLMLFRSGEPGAYALRQGWSWVRGDGVWSTGARSTIALTIPPTKGAALVIDAAALLDARRPSLNVGFAVAGRTAEEVYNLPTGHATTVVPIPDSDVDRAVTLEVNIRGAPDSLPYGIRLFGLLLKPDAGS